MKKLVVYICFCSVLFFYGCVKNKYAKKDIQDRGLIDRKKVIIPINGSALSPKTFQKLAKKTGWILIDIRNEWERREFGIVPGTDLEKNVYDVEAVKYLESLDPEGKYLIYCYHGNRSFYLKDYLIKEKGFKHIYDLEGGINRWSSEGYGTGK